MNIEQLPGQIAYTESKIKDYQKTIDYYKSICARKDLTSILDEIKDLKKTVADLTGLLENGPQKREGLKVLVTEYNGNLIIETLNCNEFDEDFVPAGQGRIGCSLSNNERLGISEKALELIKTFKRVGDAIGDLMGEENNFTWIGGLLRVADKNAVVCRYFKMPKNYKLIDNAPSKEAIEYINNKSKGLVSIEYDNFEQEIWISLSKSGSWKIPEGSDKMEHVYDNYFTLENTEGAQFVRDIIYDSEIQILNASEGMIKEREEGSRKILINPELKAEILATVKNIFSNNKILDSEIMSYINPLFDLGFDNNIMNPDNRHWRMSITATPEVILEKLKSFKRDL